MTKPKTLHDDTLKLLSFLLDLLSRSAGYEVRGARGWATSKQIQTSTKVWATHEFMRAQAKVGRVIGHDARAPGQEKPLWLYRVSQKGADAIAAALGVPAATVEDPPHPEETRVLLTESARHALAALKAAREAPAEPPRRWVEGETGWRSALELTAEQDLASRIADTFGRSFTGDDLRWLAKIGLAESRIVGHTHVYRLLPRGAEIQTLEWREPTDAA